MLLQTKALVIDSYDFFNGDKIIEIFSENEGFITIYAKGVNKLISKNKFSLQTFSLSHFEIFYSAASKMNKLKRGLIINANMYISKDYHLYLLFNYFTDVLTGITSSLKKEFSELFNFVESFLLKSNEDDWLVGMTFLFYKLLYYTGTKFHLNDCYYCKSKSNIKTFCFELYSFICKNCFKYCNEKVNLSFLKLLHYWNNNNNYQSAIEYFESNSELDDVHVLLICLLDLYNNELGIFTNALYAILKTDYFVMIRNNVEKLIKDIKNEI